MINDIQRTILIQLASYLASMLIVLLGIAFLMRGFFFKYMKVRGSLGRKILIKCRGAIRDYFFTGEIKYGFLTFKDRKDGKKFDARIAFNKDDYNAVYRCMGINWIDIDEERQAICTVDYKAVSGFDTKKFSDLFVRACQEPQIDNAKEKLILFLLLIIAVLCAVAIYMGYLSYHKGDLIYQYLPSICKGIVKPITGA